MNVSPNELRKETVAAMKEVDDLLNGPTRLEASIRAPLLLAKIQGLNTLVLLNEPRKR